MLGQDVIRRIKSPPTAHPGSSGTPLKEPSQAEIWLGCHPPHRGRRGRNRGRPVFLRWRPLSEGHFALTTHILARWSLPFHPGDVMLRPRRAALTRRGLCPWVLLIPQFFPHRQRTGVQQRCREVSDWPRGSTAVHVGSHHWRMCPYGPQTTLGELVLL